MERTQNFPKDEKRIRIEHKKLRQGMTQEEVVKKSLSICDKLMAARWYENCTWVYGYYPLGNEVDCLAFLRQALRDGKRVALPRMVSGAECRMDFYEVRSLDEVEKGGFCVMEPTEQCPMVEEEHAAVLVPGVVFDKVGNRYGYGKGYYDRYFFRFPHLYKIGLAYEHQMEESLRVTTWDVKMDCIYTE